MFSKSSKKLLPTKKGWKSFKATFQTKLANFNISTTIKRTKKFCISAYCFIHRLIPRKLYALTSRSSSSSGQHHFRYYRQQNYRYKPSFSAIYIDELFPWRKGSFSQPIIKSKEIVASSSSYENRDNMEKIHDQIVGSSGLKIDEKKKAKKGKTETGETSRIACGDNAWKLPQFRGVDERAEEFISKFREERKLEREKSIIDFQEMLARSS